MDVHFFDKGQRLDLENDYIGEEEDLKDVEFEGIDVVTWKKKNRLWVGPQEHTLEVLTQYYDNQVAGH